MCVILRQCGRSLDYSIRIRTYLMLQKYIESELFSFNYAFFNSKNPIKNLLFNIKTILAILKLSYLVSFLLYIWKSRIILLKFEIIFICSIFSLISGLNLELNIRFDFFLHKDGGGVSNTQPYRCSQDTI